MSPDHESSYYEIALTNRQVLTIFVVLLGALHETTEIVAGFERSFGAS